MSRTALAMRAKTSPTTLMRINAAMGRPIFAGFTSSAEAGDDPGVFHLADAFGNGGEG